MLLQESLVKRSVDATTNSQLSPFSTEFLLNNLTHFGILEADVPAFLDVILAAVDDIGGASASKSSASSTTHYGTKPGHFETSKIHFPTSEGVSEVSERANE